jgi:hypothetical protein
MALSVTLQRGGKPVGIKQAGENVKFPCLGRKEKDCRCMALGHPLIKTAKPNTPLLRTHRPPHNYAETYIL